MKRLFVLIFLAFTVCGCGDEGLENLFQPQTAPMAPAAGDVVTAVPPRIQALLFDEFGSREELMDRLIDLEHGDPQVDEEFMADWLLRVICKMDRQRAYYQKYISAGGIAIVGNADMPDRFFINARNIVLQMTAKRPEIREKLFPRTGFYMILVGSTLAYWELPENIFRRNPSRAIGFCLGSRYCYAYVSEDYQNPLPQGYPIVMNTFVHEFAHAMEWVITHDGWTQKDPPELLPPLDPAFEDRLKTAYEAAKAANKWRIFDPAIIDGEVGEVDVGPAYIMKNYKEYWAEGVVYWYYLDHKHISFASREEFAAYDPLLYELLAEWFHEGSFAGL